MLGLEHKTYAILKSASEAIKTASVVETIMISAYVRRELDELGDNEKFSGNRAELDCMELIRMRQLKAAAKKSTDPIKVGVIIEDVMKEIGNVL